ncbi:exopolysaccharide biosynthesis protein [Ahrensia kielensis]|uniref:exopolysaccharide biosynthesis protein n=1 Tax=Ahrensia kielensis TaxID=76980 RepID=UPI000364BE1F|nr:exopolysaccharide biosynthesis protein [Ahrensia kielensis]
MCDDKASGKPGRLSRIVDEVKSGCEDATDKIKVTDLLSIIGDKSLLPAMLLPALIVATPLSGIPGVSSVGGLIIALFSFELIFNFREIYLPKKLRSHSIDPDKLSRSIDRITPIIKWIDKHSRSRIQFLFHRPFIWIPQLVCLLTGLSMPFLEFVPFSSSIAAIGVTLLVISMLTEDGLFFLLAVLPYVFGIYLIV